MSRTRLAPFALALLLCAGLASAVSAAEEEKSCVDQIAELCPDTEPNSPQRRACVKEKRSQLSADCQKKLGPSGPGVAPAGGAPLEELRPLLEACGSDRAKLSSLCTGANAQGPPLFQCIVDHKGELSQKCVDFAQKNLPPAKPGAAPAK